MKTITLLIKICAFIFIIELSVLFIADWLDTPVQEIKVSILCCGALYALLSWWYIDTHRK